MPVRTSRYLPPTPQHILDRHDARVLSPSPGAPQPSGYLVPAPTVYRARSLRIPADLLDGGDRPAIDAALAGIGLELVRPEPGRGERNRPVVLRARGGQQPSPDVDAWQALQQLRNRVSKAVADRIGLEHLLFPDNWTGVEGAYTPSGPGGNAVADLSSYVRTRGEGGRLPVVLYARKPARCTDVALPRRPVVAVLDTGVSGHAWLDVPETTDPDGTGFVIVDTGIQGQIAADPGAPSTLRPLATFREQPIGADLTAGPDNLLCGLGTHWGHGTFIAGIIRQAVPDARVLAIRVMYSDGIAHESDVLCALEAVESRVRQAQAQGGDPSRMIDIVSLSIGYYPEDVDAASPDVTACIDRLTALGVLVCAAAGNGSTDRKFYPAALADPQAVVRRPVISVGSLNPNRSKALFSNDGDWVRYWAPGAAVVSTFPRSTGSLGPDYRLAARAPELQPQWRESLDDDDFDSGFALWNGTSFAAPMVAAQLARALIEGHRADLGNVTAEACGVRATAVSEALSEYVLPE